MTAVVITHDIDDIIRRTFNDLRERHGYNVVFIGPGEGGKGGIEAPAIRNKFSPSVIKEYRRILKDVEPDVLFTHSTSGLSTSLRALRGNKNVKIIGYRGTQAKISSWDPFNYLALLNRRVDHVVCATEDIRQMVAAKIGDTKTSLAVKPYHPDWAADAVKNPVAVQDIDPGALSLVTVGHFDGRPHKGLHYLLEAVRLLESSDVKVHLTVVGEVSQKDRENAPRCVTFVGRKSNALNYIAACKVYVLPSTRDASPRTIREAMACGLPSIVSDIPGARDLIADTETGLLFRAADVENLASKIRLLAEDRNMLERLAANCRPYLEKHFNPKKYTDYFAELFERLKR